ncbi:S-layer homology domain-containing protein [Lawsonibacter celer]|uniref:S-layer homology domain-containing protein n=1 Tax=Lawsonibacter celer TaxID=2986526 RepID=UPI00311AA7C2
MKCVVYDGNIISEGKYAAALIGNDNTNGDGGINADATSEIKGGTFTATLASTPALKGAPNTGNPIITGGTFSSDVSEYVADTASIGKDSNSGKWVVSSLTAETGVAETGGNYYSTLAAAVAAAGEGETVTLLKDVTLTEDVNFTHSVKLVMNGYDISIPSTLTKTLWVCNGVTLTIEGDDTSVITGSIGFPANVASGHLILNGGTYTANLSNDAMIYVNGTIQGGNRVMIDISDATLNSTDDTFYLAGNSITSVTDSTINGYTGIYMKAGTVNLENTIINAVGAYAEPVPNGNGASSTGDGIIMDSKQGYNGNMILNLGQGVKITSKNAYAVREALTDLSESSTVSVSITDGAYAGASDKAALVFSGAFNTAVGSGQATRSITGGYFTSDPSAYISDTGLDAIPGSYVVDGVTYSYKVGEALPDNVTIAAGDTEVNNPNNVDTAVVEKIAEATATGTSDSANEAAASLNESDKATAEKFNAAAGELAEGIPTASGEVATVVAPRLDITVMGYNAAENTLTLDIKAVYDIKATTDAGNMVELNDDKSNATSVNTVTLEKNAGTLDTSGTEVEITIPLPTDFVNSTSDPVFITHVKDNGVKYVYKATVASDGASGFTATFTNPHGFSSFTLTTETAASITDNGVTTYYDTLQEAVDAVANGQTIKLERDVTESPVVAKTVNFTLDLNSKSFTGSITAGANTTAAAGNPAANTGGDFSFTYTAPSGGATTYSITVEKAEHGTVTSSHRNASRGVTVTLTVKADEGYELDGLSVTDANGSELKLTDKGNGKYTFTMPGAKVTVKAAFKAAEHVCPAEKFPDVDTGAWYHEAVDYVLEKGMMQGSGSRFMPAESLSRGMLVQVLYNLEGKPAVSGSAFEDVSAQAWYADAVAWASANQVVGGYGNGKFGPEDSITREQMAAILYRYAKVKGYDTTQGGMAVREFADYEQISDWAGEAMAWAVNAKVLSGKGNHTLDPKGTASRAEVAQVLMNFGENVSK